MANRDDNTNIGVEVGQAETSLAGQPYKPADIQDRVAPTQVPTRVAGVASEEGQTQDALLKGYTLISPDATTDEAVDPDVSTPHLMGFGSGSNKGACLRDGIGVVAVRVEGQAEIPGTTTWAALSSRDGDDYIRVEWDATTGAYSLHSSAAITNDSSRTIKENIAPIKNALKRIMAFEPVSFLYKRNKRPGLGFIAEDVMEIEPVISDGRGVSYTEVVPLLVGAIQELTKRIEKLEGK